MGDLFYIKRIISSINIKLPPSSKKALVEIILENNTQTIIHQHSLVPDCLFFSVLRPQKIGVEFATRQLEFESGINYSCTIDSITANRYLCHFISPC